MANPMQSILGALSDKGLNQFAKLNPAARATLEKQLSGLVGNKAKQFAGNIDMSNIQGIKDLLMQGARSGGVAGGLGGGALGFLTAPGTEEENLLGAKKYRSATMGDRLSNALMMGGLGAAAGTGLSAYNLRDLAKQITQSGNKAAPELTEAFMRQANLIPGIEKSVGNFAKNKANTMAAPGGAGGVMGLDEFANYLTGLHADLMAKRGPSTGFSGMLNNIKRMVANPDPNDIHGMRLLSSVTGLPIESILNDPHFAANMANKVRAGYQSMLATNPNAINAVRTVGDTMRAGKFKIDPSALDIKDPGMATGIGGTIGALVGGVPGAAIGAGVGRHGKRVLDTATGKRIKDFENLPLGKANFTGSEKEFNDMAKALKDFNSARPAMPNAFGSQDNPYAASVRRAGFAPAMGVGALGIGTGLGIGSQFMDDNK